MIRRLSFLAALALCCLVQAKLTVRQAGDNFAILDDGKVIVESLYCNMHEVARPDQMRKSFATLPDGSRVWNTWCEDKEARFRLEVAERSDGAAIILRPAKQFFH